MSNNKSNATYDKCKLFYNQETGSFYYQPWNPATKKFFGAGPGKGWNVISRDTSIQVALPFTDILDAVKLMYGSKDFTTARMLALWSAYKGKHDLFDIDKPKLFFPIK